MIFLKSFSTVALIFGALAASMGALVAQAAQGSIEQRVFVDEARNQVIKLEWVSDSVIHFEFTPGAHRKSLEPIFMSQMIKNQQFAGPSSFRDEKTVFTTAETRVEYADGCFTVTDQASKHQIGRVCAAETAREWKRIEIETVGVRNIYGLGQMFERPGDLNTDRNGKVIATKGGYGHSMPTYAGGATGEAMFPVVMALGSGSNSWGLVLDNIYKQSWDFTDSKWRINMFGDQLRGFIIAGATPKIVRQRFMSLSGKAPVPPRKMFGFWMSEYGYDDWTEVRERLNGMRHDGFPIDGFYLDLQWFGNVTPGSDHTNMGKLRFDESNFPDPANTIQSFLTKDDIGLVPIEESYIGRSLEEHDDMEAKGYLAHECGHPTSASYLTGAVTGNTSEWWGKGGMIDWSNPDAGKYWHDSKRQSLIDMGVYAHWLDLGEPEMFDPNSCYHGAGEAGKAAHQDVHNLFSLLWAKSVWDGFEANHVNHRPFLMIRSGNIGLQRYGAGMWSGDIGGNLPSLASHIASHNQVAWSGIDYYSSDIGGFHRNRADGRPLSHAETEENFTEWFANATWFDVPVRSHVLNLDNDRETAPNRIGHVESNRVNLLTRYSLIPYYYSLAYEASRTGSPLMEPLAMRFADDLKARTIGGQRMLGDLLMTAVAETAAYQRDIYLPHGVWYDFFDGSHKKSNGDTVKGFPVYRDGLFRLPVFARAGAIVPRYAGSFNQRGLGLKNATTMAKSMLLDVFVDESGSDSRFELAEDDGYSRDYEVGAARVTVIEQSTKQLKTDVKITGAVGRFSGVDDLRGWTVRVWSPGWSVKSVTLGDTMLPICDGIANNSPDNSPDNRPNHNTANINASCYERHRDAGVLIRTTSSDARTAQHVTVQWDIGSPRGADVHFVCDEGRDSPRGHGMFIVGDDPILGDWDTEKAVPLHAAQYARGVWTGVVHGLASGRQMTWKCIRKIPGGGDRNVEWQPGDNNRMSLTSDGGFVGMAKVVWGRAARGSHR